MTPQTKNCKGCNYERKYNEPWEFHTCGKEQTKNTNKKCLNPTLCGQAGVSGSNFSRTWICDRCSSKNTKAVEGDWVKRFDKKFVIPKGHFRTELSKKNENSLWTNYIQNPGLQELKDFIQTELDREREGVVDMVVLSRKLGVADWITVDNLLDSLTKERGK